MIVLHYPFQIIYNLQFDNVIKLGLLNLNA